MATHSSTLALKIPWTEELGAGYYPCGCKESGMTERLHFLSFPFFLPTRVSFQNSTMLRLKVQHCINYIRFRYRGSSSGIVPWV